MDLQTKVYRFFNDYLQDNEVTDHDLDLLEAQLIFLGSLGYTGSLTTRWISFAKDRSYSFRGVLDIQNKVAQGVIDV